MNDAIWNRCDLEQKNGAIQEYITLLRANQIARIASDFKVDVVKGKICVIGIAIPCNEKREPEIVTDQKGNSIN